MSSLLGIARHRRLQPMWTQLHRLSLIGMNYWSSEFAVTGEREALRFIASNLADIGNPVVFDVGANVGDFSLACLDTFGGRCRLHAFEPSAATFAMLSDKLNSTGAELHQLAFSDREGEAVLHSSEPGSSIASLVELDRPVRSLDRALDESVRIATIDHFCEMNGVERIDFLKLDIEGHEYAALSGAADMLERGRIGALQFEFGENDLSARTFLGDIIEMLDGFDHYRIVPGGPVRWSYAGAKSEIFATMNYLAVRRPERVQA